MTTSVHPVLVACVRPVLTFGFVTLPQWWCWWRHRPPTPQVVSPRWRAQRLYEDGLRGDHP
jgi:hypothetical protein